ncbi:MAG: L-lysine 6-transaminase [Candidatus Coatesbacteria bacterium]|nr:L-lysine 6-transaminase [Candidatus Coatesbacteria bacterium]
MSKEFKKCSVKPEDVHSVLSRYILADGLNMVVDLEKSQGAYIYCSKTGKPFLDLFSYFASCPLGMNHPKLATQEFIEKLGRVALNKISNSDAYTTCFAEFVETFASHTIPEEFNHLFFIDGGALAVENALKAAFDWKVRLNLSKGKGERGHQIIHFEHAFHGRTGYTLSLTNTADPRKYIYFPKFHWPRLPSPWLHFPITEESISKVKKTEQIVVDKIKSLCLAHRQDIAALLIEPIQAEGGDRHFRKEFLQELRDLADENEFLLIFDEVQTGMGITGSWWAFQDIGVIPDIFAFGKKSQICGIASTGRIDNVPNNVFKEHSRINSTWGGNLVDMLRSKRMIEIIVEDELLKNAKETGNYIQENLLKINDERISEVRGRGMFISFDLPETSIRDNLVKLIFNNGAIILPCGLKSIRFRTPLDFKPEYVDIAMDILKKSLQEL